MFGRTNQWDISLLTSKPFYNSVLVGAGGHIGHIGGIKGAYTCKLYDKVLSHEYIHSVRTKEVETELKSLGFRAIDTGCVSLWKLVPELCREIPVCKAKNAVVTLTDYNRNI